MASFDEAVKKVLWLEGGPVDDPADPGGRTVYGITERDHPDLWANGPPTREQAVERYRRDYWRPLYDQIENQDLASELMEFGVVAGRKTAVLLLQKALEKIGAYGPIRPVGNTIFGPVTLSLTNRADPISLLREFRVEQIVRYVKLGEERPALRKFLRGWIWRALA